MPTATITHYAPKYAKQNHLTLEKATARLESLWDLAKTLTTDETQLTENEGDDFYRYVMGVWKRMTNYEAEAFDAVAAVAVNRYAWYKLVGSKGKRLTIDGIKVEVRVNQPFGLRTIGGIQKLALETNKSVSLYNITNRQASFLLADSKGYSGKVNGVNVTAGTLGGLDKGSKPDAEAAHSVTQAIKSSPLYPKLKMPVSKEDMAKLYVHYNKLLFNNECPPVGKVAFVQTVNKSATGLARIIVRKDISSLPVDLPISERYVYSLTVSKVVVTPKRFVEVFVHEMIHLKWYYQYVLTLKQEYFNVGHGDLFLKDAARITKAGIKIEVLDHYGSDEEESGMNIYTLAARNPDGSTLFISSLEQFSSELPNLIKSLKSRIPRLATSGSSFIYGPSKHPYIFTFAAVLPKNKMLPRKKFFVYRATQIVEGVIKTIRSEYTETVKAGEVSAHVENSLAEVMSRLPRVSTFFDVISSFVEHHNGIKLSSADYKTVKSNLTPSTFDVVFKRWADLPDSELFNSSKSSPLQIMRRDFLRQGIDKKAATDKLAEFYWLYLHGRRTPEEFAELVNKTVGDVITYNSVELRKELLHSIQENEKTLEKRHFIRFIKVF